MIQILNLDFKGYTKILHFPGNRFCLQLFDILQILIMGPIWTQTMPAKMCPIRKCLRADASLAGKNASGQGGKGSSTIDAILIVSLRVELGDQLTRCFVPTAGPRTDFCMNCYYA